MPRIRQNAEQDAMKDLVGEINAQRARFGYNTFPEFGKVLGVCPTDANMRNYADNIEITGVFDGGEVKITVSFQEAGKDA